jgi:hypothetical protein
MRLDYSSSKRTAKHYNGVRSITKYRTRRFTLRTSSARRKSGGMAWGSVIVLLVKVALAVAEGLLGSGKWLIRRPFAGAKKKWDIRANTIQIWASFAPI